MFAVSPVYQSTTALALPPSVLADAASVNAVTTRQTSVAVSAPLPNQLSADNPQGNTQGGNNVAFSATLNAQILAQQDAQNVIALSTNFARLMPAPQYNAFIGYGLVKYKPSDAGIPSLRQAEAAAAASTTTMGSAYQAYNDTQSRNQSNLFEASAQIIIAG